MRSGYDVVVVGARIAGASTAMLLGRAGLRVLVLERGRPGTDTVSTHALMRAGVLQLSRWGLLDAVVAAGTPAIRTSTFRYAGQPPLRIPIRPSAGVEALSAPRRRLLDGILVDAAADAGAAVRFGANVSGLLRDGSGRVRGVATVDGRRYSADLVVGADGVHSRIASLAAAPVIATRVGASAVRYRYVEGLDPDGYEWSYGSGAAVGVIPTNDGCHCVFVATTPERMRSTRASLNAESAFDAILRAVDPAQADRVAGARLVGRETGWRGRTGFLRQSWGAGWALVGDAGSFKDPITSHGISDALRDSELLAHAIVDGLGSAGEQAALESYQRTRDRLTLPLLTAGADVARYDWADEEIPGILRRLSAAMVDEVSMLEHLALPGSEVRSISAG
ncbi:FAD-dependent monooxygenase [Agromyces intestinalis]|uniref:FAD-dependent monooxygenase n=2 Tax=Agromyces intestinalis TaxID=2592652 RepID=A0A5C1YAT1_9MICO|nr:NAD(P)/FAD-dependent oxidoreductase [Agromyces intestinalis]QEO13091.1 FAD-dependent monooxygenase [Agromyces intestinalis]